jgi:hypothetical protein
VSTRKLILAALLCGVAIMVAGGVKLAMTLADRTEVTVLDLGEEARLGDMTVAVTDVVDVGTRTAVTVTMVGVAGADATEGWRLLAGGVVASPVPAPGGDDAGSASPVPEACTVTDAANAVECTVWFPASEGTRTVAYLRSGLQRQWSR